MAQEFEKLKKMILFISDYCNDKPNFGATHLNKILYYSDFFHFLYTGKSISESEYFKLEKGPAPRYLVPAREELKSAGLLEIQERPTFGGYTQKRTVPTSKVDDSFLDDEQKQLIRDLADQCCDRTATLISLVSHKHLAWELADLKQTIPLYTIHCTKLNPITKESKKWAMELARQAGIVS